VRRGLKDQLKKLNAQIDSFIKENERELLHGFGFTVQGKAGGTVQFTEDELDGVSPV
jgi:hypothetical protein